MDTYQFPCLGALIGDTVGSVYEFDNIKTTDFQPLFDKRARPLAGTVRGSFGLLGKALSMPDGWLWWRIPHVALPTAKVT